MSASAQAMMEARRAALEAEAAGNSSLPETATPNADGSPVAAPTAEPNVEIVKTRGDSAREAIYARASAARANNADETGMTAAVEAMIAETTGAPSGDPIAPNDAITRALDSAPAKSGTSPLANGSDTITVTIDGRAIAVPTAEVMRQGIGTIQKTIAADLRLQRASLAEQALAAERQALDARAAEIDRLRATTVTGAAPAATDEHLPSGGQPSIEATEKALNALLDSDVNGAAKGLSRIIAEQVDARLKAAAPSVQPPVSAPSSAPAAPWSESDIREANAFVSGRFPDIVKHPQAAEQFTARIVAEMASPSNRLGKVNLMVLAENVGKEIRQAYSAPAPQPQANGVDELAARRTLAARVPGVPSSAVPRSVGSAPQGPAPLSRSEQVALMRKQRGQA